MPLTWNVRRGYSLIEMITVIGMISLVMTSVAVTISSLHRLNTKLRDDLPTSAAVVSLGLKLRTDAHAARQATVVPANQQEQKSAVLRLSLADQRIIEYSANQSRVSRQIRLAEQIERNEVFELPRDCQLVWSVNDEKSPLVTLKIQRHTGKMSGAQDDVRVTTIVTAVGLDHVAR